MAVTASLSPHLSDYYIRQVNGVNDIFRFKIGMGVVKKCTKMSTPFQMNFSAQKYASHTTSVVIDDVIIISRRLLCKYIIREVLM